MLKRFLILLRLDSRGAAQLELALSLPILVTLGFGTIQWADAFYVRNQVQMTAVTIADNASRMRHDDNFDRPLITEADINDVLLGATIQGNSVNLRENGRVVISSLEQNSRGGQWIHWQRCIGDVAYRSAYLQGVGASGQSFPGARIAQETIKARPGQAVMVVEVILDHEPVVSIPILGAGKKRYAATATMEVRGGRDLDRIINDAPPSMCTGA